MGNLSGKVAKPGAKFNFIAGRLDEKAINDLATAVKRDGFSDNPEHVQHYPKTLFYPAKTGSISHLILPSDKYFVVVGTADEVLLFIKKLHTNVNAFGVDSGTISASYTPVPGKNTVLLAIGDTRLVDTDTKSPSWTPIAPQNQKGVPELAKNLLRLDGGFTSALATTAKPTTAKPGAKAYFGELYLSDISIDKLTRDVQQYGSSEPNNLLNHSTVKRNPVPNKNSIAYLNLPKLEYLVLAGTADEIKEFLSDLNTNEVDALAISDDISGRERAIRAVCTWVADQATVLLVIGNDFHVTNTSAVTNAIDKSWQLVSREKQEDDPNLSDRYLLLDDEFNRALDIAKSASEARPPLPCAHFYIADLPLVDTKSIGLLADTVEEMGSSDARDLRKLISMLSEETRESLLSIRSDQLLMLAGTTEEIKQFVDNLTAGTYSLGKISGIYLMHEGAYVKIVACCTRIPGRQDILLTVGGAKVLKDLDDSWKFLLFPEPEDPDTVSSLMMCDFGSAFDTASAQLPKAIDDDEEEEEEEEEM